MAWRDNSAVRSGVLTLEDGSFVPFPSLPASSVTNLGVGVGGSTVDPRAYVTWVGNSLELILGVFDADGALVKPPAPIASAVQVVPVRIAGTDAGAIVGHAWDTNAYWDARGLSLDPNGSVQQEVVAENVVSPEQTLGVSVSAGSGGRYGILYVVSDTHDARLRRFDTTGPLDPAPVEVIADAGGDYIPYSVAYAPEGASPFLFIAVPTSSPAVGADLRFVHTTLEVGGVTVGPLLSDLSPAFPGSAVDMAGLVGNPELAVVLWQEIQRQDPCVCTTPPPVRVDFVAQAVRAGPSPQAEGARFVVYRWLDGDLMGPPLTLPVIAPSRETPGRFTVVWSDGLLRYTRRDLLSPVTVGPRDPRSEGLAALGPAFPNPFSLGTTLRYRLREAATVRLVILDLLGREVATLVSAYEPAGEHVVRWEARDEHGAPAAPGMYVARLEAGREVHAAKLITIR